MMLGSTTQIQPTSKSIDGQAMNRQISNGLCLMKQNATFLRFGMGQER